MAILTQFIFRASFGLALAMAITDPRRVTSGYYRNHAYVLLGFNALATMVAFTQRDRFLLAPPLLAAIVSYLAAVLWLYEKPRAGQAMLAMVAAAALWGAWSAMPSTDEATAAETVLSLLDAPTAGLVLGSMLAAMFLGHWYLNSPGMAIGPLKRLVALAGAAIVLRAVVEAAALALGAGSGQESGPWAFEALRWLSGIVGALVVVAMTWQTLKIPNTQSATGILYVGVIVTFLGELAALVMATQVGSIA